MRSHAALLAVALLLVASQSGAHAQAAESDAAVTMEVRLQADGDAQWNVTAAFPLSNENETTAFRRLGAAYENGTAEVGPDPATFRRLADRAETATGRTMTVDDVSREARIVGEGDRKRGLVSLRFRWTNFSTKSGDRLVVGDVFDSAWRLAEDQRLVIHSPENYGFTELNPPQDRLEDGTIVWVGPESFEATDPSITYVRGAAPATSATTAGDPGTSQPPGGPFESGVGFVAAVVGALLIGGVAAYALARRTPDDAPDGDAPASSTAAPEGAESTATSASDSEAVEAVAGSGTASTAATGGDPGDAADAGEGESAGTEDAGAVDPELLSDEERVEHLLERNGGRMKQANIVEETGWSNAKVSQLLSAMDEADRIDKLRIGRENLISLGDEAE